MNVKEIFAMRKQGRIEEAYEAIRPIYAVHKGRFTTLCMFWVGCDVFKLRLEQKRIEEAEKIYEALKRMLPHVRKIEEEDSKAEPEVAGKQEQSRQKNNASGFMHYAEGRLIKASEKFRKRYFAMRDKKRGKAKDSPVITIPSSVIPSVVEGSLHKVEMTITGNDEGIYNPSDIPSEEVTNVPEGINGEELNAGQLKVLECIKEYPGNSVPKLSEATNIPSKSIERHIKVLIERKLIEHRGSKKTGGYHALDSTFGRLLP